MSSRRRQDHPNAWHHVMNRGIARRTLFESRIDMRKFLARLAIEVRAGRLEIHAFAILTTHFHMLVRSPTGELSGAMQRVQNSYSRWFNRSRRRDGPLVRGRFLSKPVESLRYRILLVRYIDANPVAAGVVPTADLYRHGSAYWYARDRGPVWLERSWVESLVRERARDSAYVPASYRHVLGPRGNDRAFSLVERRLALAGGTTDELDDLLGAAPPRVRAWMRRKAALADGTDIGAPVCDEASVEEAVREARVRDGPWTVRPTREAVDAWLIARIGLLRALCGTALADASRRAGCALATAWTAERRHRELTSDDEVYAARVAALAHVALERCHGDITARRAAD